MPAKSKAQHKLMAAMASGSILKKGLSPAKAREFLSSESLPQRKNRKLKASEI